MGNEELICQIPQFYLDVICTLCVSDMNAVEYFLIKVLYEEEKSLDEVGEMPAIVGLPFWDDRYHVSCLFYISGLSVASAFWHSVACGVPFAVLHGDEAVGDVWVAPYESVF